MAKGLSGNELKLGKGVLISGEVSQVGDKGVDRCFCCKGGLQGSSGAIKMGWHCCDLELRDFIAKRGFQ